MPGVPPDLIGLLTEAAAGMHLALVGGAVRDLLLHRLHNDPWRGLPDLDLVVEGSAPELVRQLASSLAAGAGVLKASREHGAYGTVELELEVAGQLLLLDVATARREIYPQLAENPQVSFGCLADDLARRDFTINAIALDLTSSALLDPHGGQADLQARQLRFLHGGSLADDPTRLVRAARYGARLGFELAPESLQQVQATLKAWPWQWRLGDRPDQAPPALATRLRMELELLLEREPWLKALELLQGWGGMALLDPQLQADRFWRLRLNWAQRAGLPLLVALVACAQQPLALAERLQLPHRQHRLLTAAQALLQRLGALENPAALSVPQWCELLEAPGCPAEAVALLLVSTAGRRPRWRRPLLRWWLRWRQLQAPISAHQLIAEGIQPGPELGARLRQARATLLQSERS
ncbi:CCA tRNA nucleotidyltransferase [Cyanobium sp. WAJ14-Wanaka]|uniref:CCA tRNA nucleotidyltransferase n=1 Tax=Cyanobium sp. WAJ14-Wanaka TaxID=2823725 RepID=UPI0020CD0571|nr:CCA tRNA nucleotidyltransferase [Cyanobium sp. WAJ14-Wanaka]MCP9775766.1 CCA tRNA nucleotidyltransferase [Cyanobium sp. WAJ14-Wanaka]